MSSFTRVGDKLIETTWQSSICISHRSSFPWKADAITCGRFLLETTRIGGANDTWCLVQGKDKADTERIIAMLQCILKDFLIPYEVNFSNYYTDDCDQCYRIIVECPE